MSKAKATGRSVFALYQSLSPEGQRAFLDLQSSTLTEWQKLAMRDNLARNFFGIVGELQAKVVNQGKGGRAKKNKKAQRRILLGEQIAAGVSDPHALFDYVKDQDETLLYRNQKLKAKGGFISTESMMKDYYRHNRATKPPWDNCSSPGQLQLS